ncbi:MAG: TraR/DksA family transcriptional regulator [Alphaproteobacteria bacterium]
MHDTETLKRRLESQLDELEARQARIAGELSEPPSRDWEEQAIEREDDDALQGEGIIVSREIASIRRALARIDDGSYGVCVRCGEDIAPARLEARPEAALCIQCARAAM